MNIKLIRAAVLLFSTVLLSGCNMVLFDSSGATGREIGDTMLLTMGLMLLVVIPTILLSIFMPAKYHTSKTDAEYDPEWDHSSKIEFWAWGVPVIIIVILATIAYKTSYSLDPSKEIESDLDPVTIQVVAMDWKWLFIYPEQQVATVNEIAFPANRPVEFLITSATTMNSFFIPALGSQIYAMAGMENRLNLMATEEGEYRGISSNYSGFGFAGMRFKAHAVSEEGFQQWLDKVKASGAALSDAEYARLQEKTRDHKVEYFSSVEPLHYKNIIESFTGVQNGPN